MNFGHHAFAEAPFAAQGGVTGVNVVVQVTGNQVNLQIGDATIVAAANVQAVGSQVTTQVGDVTIIAKANVLPTGNEVNIQTGQEKWKFKPEDEIETSPD